MRMGEAVMGELQEVCWEKSAHGQGAHTPLQAEGMMGSTKRQPALHLAQIICLSPKGD